MSVRRLNDQEWADVRLEYETSADRPTLRELADKHQISRSTIFKRAAREKWKQNATIMEAARKQIVTKMEAKMEAATSEAAQLVAKQMVEDLRPFIQREKAEHIVRAVTMGKRGFERIQKLWDEREPVDPKDENLSAATLDRHDGIVRRNLGMNNEVAPMSPLNLNVLSQNTVISIAEKAPAEEPS